MVAGQCDDGAALGEQAARHLLTVGVHFGSPVTAPDDVEPQLAAQLAARISREISKRNARFFEGEANKLDGWADDLKVRLERELKELDRQINEARRATAVALTLEEKLAGQEAVKALEAERSARRNTLFDEQERIDSLRAELIAQIEAKLEQGIEMMGISTICWSVR